MKPQSKAQRSLRFHPELTRRRFLATGTGAVAAARLALGPSATTGAAETQAGAEMPAIDPGYIGPQYFDRAEQDALREVVESGSPFRYWGPGRPRKVQDFEDAFARVMGSRFALGVTSGTAALDCAMAALDIGPGDEVIVPSYTWWSDYTCVVHAGALPVFAEIDRTLNLDPGDLERKITPRTKAVIAVHLLGGPCDMEPILTVARRQGLRVVEDCAQCVGGSYQGKPLGSLGDVGIYSFQINKTMTSGEGGALVTSDPLMYERAARFHDMGTLRPLFLERIGAPSRAPTFAGENFRMSELSGAMLGAQLPKLRTMVDALRRHATAVLEAIQDVPGLRLRQRPDPSGDIGYAVFFETKDREARDRCLQGLRQRNVPASPPSGSVLLPAEESVIQKRARHPGWPSFTSPQGRAMRYGPDLCPQTRGILDRFVQVRIGPNYTARIDEHIARAIREVHAAHAGV